MFKVKLFTAPALGMLENDMNTFLSENYDKICGLNLIPIPSARGEFCILAVIQFKEQDDLLKCNNYFDSAVENIVANNKKCTYKGLLTEEDRNNKYEYIETMLRKLDAVYLCDSLTDDSK